jgi:endonuclease/exonuclease/phosphatase family metal-dependent hydrolase
LIAFLAVTEYRPQKRQPLEISGSRTGKVPSDTLTFLTWNIGYSGLGKEMDFFYDGGTRVRPAEPDFRQSLSGILETVKNHDSLDFLLLQEVDLDSKRSFYENEAGKIGSITGHYRVFAANYNVRFVPVPLFSPMGKVVSGLLALSAFEPRAAVRIGFDERVSWPKRLIFLKRCFQVLFFQLDNGKELVVINIHNSAYDPEGKMRRNELAQLKEFINSEYRKGNYVIAGGDWNDNPAGFMPGAIRTGDCVFEVKPRIDPGSFSGWIFAYDPHLPTNRNVDRPYVKGITGTTIIDFFVVSPNVEILSVKTLGNNFAWSDHQPVLMKVRLRL